MTVTERVGVFALGSVSGRAALAYHAGRVVVDRRRAEAKAEKALQSFAPGAHNILDGKQVAAAAASAFMLSSTILSPAGMKQDAHEPVNINEAKAARAAFVFVDEMMTKFNQGDKAVMARFGNPSGTFNTRACLKAFYGCSASPKLVEGLAPHPLLTPEVRDTVVRPLVEEVWKTMRQQLRKDAIDLLLL